MSRTKTHITVEEFNTRLEEGPYTFPGGYPLYLVMNDGESLSFAAAKSEAETIIQAIEDNDTTGGWLPIGFDVNWEDEDLVCAHTGERIPSAYGSDD
jgi:hypothetical protein